MGIQRQINRIQQNIENTYAVMEALGADLPEEQTSDNLSATAGTAKPVLYKEQTLTEDEKAQARANIGAAAVGEGGGGGGVLSWNDLPDKPVVTTEGGDTLTWDGNTEGLVCTTVWGIPCYKLSDAILTENDIGEEALMYFANGVGLGKDEGLVQATLNGLVYGADGLFLAVPNDNFVFDDGNGNAIAIPEKGVYFGLSDGNYPTSLTIPNYTGFTTEKIDPAYLYQPDWNQTDESKPDAIKNRPFGVKDATFVDGTLAFESGGYTGIITNSPFAGSDVTIEIDGATYVRKFVELNADNLATGNLSMLGAGDDTGEPFVIIIIPAIGMILFNHADAETSSHVVKVSGKTIVKIPTVYYDGADLFYGNDGYLYTDINQTTKVTKADVTKRGVKTPIIIMFGNSYLLAVEVDISNAYAELYTYTKGSSMIFRTAEYVPPETTET